jgi:hypothetical protein
MGVLDSEDLDGGHPPPVHSSIFSRRHGLVVWDENQPVRVVEVERDLALAVSLQFVEAPWEVPQIFQARRRTERIEPRTDQLGATGSVRKYQRGLLVALLLEFPLFKQDIHKWMPCQ